MNHVFVYGTLMRGQRNFHYLRESRFIGEFTTKNIYSMYRFDDYPAVCVNGRHAIQGEVFQIDDEQFTVLDALERYPDFYQRMVIDTDYGQAWMYIVSQELCRGRPRLQGIWGQADRPAASTGHGEGG